MISNFFRVLLTCKPRSCSKKNTIQAAQDCTTLRPGHSLPLEVLTSCEPYYFEPLGLPHRVSGAHIANPLSLQNLLNPAEQERALGLRPCLTRRAAAHYGINREAWEREAALRWRRER